MTVTSAEPRQLGRDEMAVIPALLRLPTGWIEPGPNVRAGDFGDLGELAASLEYQGQELPVVVEQLGDRRYRLIDGERRWRAACRDGISHLDAVLRRGPSDRDRILRQLRIQSHTRPFNAVAEARALHRLRFTYGLSREEIAALAGHPVGWVRDRLALLSLTPAEQAAVERRELPVTTALLLARARRVARDAGGDTSDREPRRQARRATPAGPVLVIPTGAGTTRVRLPGDTGDRLRSVRRPSEDLADTLARVVATGLDALTADPTPDMR
jgi:ParB/RepB/Spo0J family partition protein